MNFTALNGPKYKAKGLDKILDRYFDSDPLLDAALTSIVIPAFDTKLQQPVFFSSWRVSVTMSSHFCGQLFHFTLLPVHLLKLCSHRKADTGVLGPSNNCKQLGIALISVLPFENHSNRSKLC
jgi:hypothetical protein